MLTYHCGPGQYPYPVSYRLCSADGEWSPMRLANGRQVSRATCKGNVLHGDALNVICTQTESRVHNQNFLSTHIPLLILPPLPSISLPLPDMLCPAQLQLDNGDFWPRDQWFRVGATQSFSCQEGFTLYGSAQRNCTLSGEWTGTTPVCDNHGEDGQHYKHCSL